MTVTTKLYARATAFVEPKPIILVCSYTIGKDYEVVDGPDHIDGGCDFTIIDDEGDPMPCWWDGTDPDVIWERIEK